MLTLAELTDFLNRAHSQFEIIEHQAPILTVKDADTYFDSKKAAPVFIIKTEKGLYALIVSSEHGRIDFKSTGRKLGFNKFNLADKTEILEATGYKTGSIPLVGHNLPCFFDRELLALDFIFGGIGDAYHTLKINPNDIISLNKNVRIIEITNK